MNKSWPVEAECIRCDQVFTYIPNKTYGKRREICEPCYEEYLSEKDRHIRVQRWSKEKLAKDKKMIKT